MSIESVGEKVKSAAQVKADVRAIVRNIILDKELAGFDKRRQVFRVIERELCEGGYFCRTGDDRLFYFRKPERRLYDLDQQAFRYLLTNISGLSPSETEFRFVLPMLSAQAAQTRPVEVHSFAYFDAQIGTLAVSDCGPGVWIREKNGDWTLSRNGENGLLFFNEPDSTPWEPDFGEGHDALAWLLSRLLFADGSYLTAEDRAALYLVNLLHLFFPALRRTRVIPAFLGPQGSGKSTAIRLTGRLLVGSHFDVTNLRKEKEDAFVAAVTNRTVAGFDNADSRVRWLEDALATYATGLRYQLRRYYTTNDEVSYLARAIVMISSRDPHFRRADVSERLLPLWMRRPDKYLDEPGIYAELDKYRPLIWGGLLRRVADIADSLQSPPSLGFRMADFAAFGWQVFARTGQQDSWVALLDRLEREQAEFASEGDGVIETLRVMLERDGQVGPTKVGDLFKQCADIASEQGLAFPDTKQGFGQKLTGMRQVIEIELDATFSEERGHARQRTLTISRRPKAGT